MQTFKKIKYKLEEEFSPTVLEIINDSKRHINHAEKDPKNNESHFIINISAVKFNNLSLLQAHRSIYKTLHKELNDIHALSINILKQ